MEIYLISIFFVNTAYEQEDIYLSPAIIFYPDY